ncbi:SAM-dependent methyltransferase [Amycolatopsis sp.]|uniref:SAM-dependent methyltransferase n=1 Tax=Amycolatopsis sp. TaxID=37632 RepID=UPI0039C8A562
MPPEVDLRIPNSARVYDYLLDGDHNFQADRELADKIMRIMPGAREVARINRAFLRRAALFLVSTGVRQFLDIGSGIPTVGNLHEIVQQADPTCRVVYVDKDPVAVAHSRLLLKDNDRATVLHADLRDVTEIFAGAAELLDFGQRVGLFMLLLLHFAPDSWDPFGIVARYRDHLASGSYFALSHGSADSQVPGQPEASEEYRKTQTDTFTRTHDEVLRFFTGFELVEPGLVGSALWRPQGVGDISDNPDLNALCYVGVGRKP